jgi:RHS repeat-associated protein
MARAGGFTGHEHLIKLYDIELINMNARLYDPVVGRMLRWDIALAGSGTQGFNRYSYALNNPLKYTDPSGEFLTGIELISNIAAPIFNLAQGNYTGNYGKFFLDVGIGIVNGAIAEVNPLDWNMGGGLRAGASLSFFSTTDGIGFSAQIGVSVGIGNWRFADAAIGITTSTTGYGTNNADVHAFASIGVGLYHDESVGNARFGNKKGAMLRMNWYFAQDGTSQRTGSLSLYGGSWGGNQNSLTYENDYLSGFSWTGDGGDRFRSAALRLQVGRFEAGFNLFTGDPGLKKRNPIGADKVTGFLGTYEEIGEKYREGIFYVGFNGYRLGINSEGVRNLIQNKVAHGNGYGNGFPIFQVLDKQPKLYYGYSKNSKHYTLW